MKLLVMDDFDGEEWGIFPLFPKGTKLDEVKEDIDKESIHWFPCVIDGHEFWTPDHYVTDNALNCEYNPTSLTVKEGQVVTLLEVAFEWFYVKDQEEKEGWLPANIVISIQ